MGTHESDLRPPLVAPAAVPPVAPPAGPAAGGPAASRAEAGGVVGGAGVFDFPQLFAAHFEELARYAYRYVQSIDEAKDIVHDAFFRLWQQQSQVDSRTSVRAYLFTTVRHLAVDRLRRHRVRERWRERWRERREEPGAGSGAEHPERTMAQQELRVAVAAAVAALPQRQREVLLLRWHRQATYDEIAQALGISPKTVSVHVTRALATLRDRLGPLFGPGAD